MVEITKCRICKSPQLSHVMSLDEQSLTGVFPKSLDEPEICGPVDLVWCRSCSLLQLAQSYPLSEMYGAGYGYRSGLNKSMVRHLETKARCLQRLCDLKSDDIVLDIGSSDGTLLRAFTTGNRIGFDPSASKFTDLYDGMCLVPEFFSAAEFKRVTGGHRAKLVTSIAMLYDLEDPTAFVRDVYESLADDGIWHFEQSYLPSMLRTGSYDTICHEHLEFYSLTVVKRLIENCGFAVLDVETNDVNGGSFAVTAVKTGPTERAGDSPNYPIIDWMLVQEDAMHLDTIRPYIEFEERAQQHSSSLWTLIYDLVTYGKKVAGYGASTKGNVLLQYCQLGGSPKLIDCVYDVNSDKFGCFTPGTDIPIVSNNSLAIDKPDYLLVLPWHFKHGILERECEFRERGGRFIFPFPEIEIL